MPTVVSTSSLTSNPCYLIGNQADAHAFQAKVAQLLGFPKAGTNIGGGVHCSAVESTTKRQSDVFHNTTLSQWALQEDAATDSVFAAAEAALPTVIVSAPTAVDSTWNSAPTDNGV